jgi:hypothetical protein
VVFRWSGEEVIPTGLGPRPRRPEPLPRRPRTLAGPLGDLIPTDLPKGARLPLTLSRRHGGSEWRGRGLWLAGEESRAVVASEGPAQTEEWRGSERRGGTSDVRCGGEGKL